MIMSKNLFLQCFFLSVILFLTLFLLNKGSYLYTLFVHSSFLAAAFFLLWDESSGLSGVFKKIGVPPANWLQAAAYSVIGLATIIALMFVLSILLSYINYADNEKVFEKLGEVPLWILPFAVIIAPFTEEVFFRGALVPRIGVIGSSVLFGALHVFYGSVMEVVGTILVGIVLAFVFKRTGSVVPSIFIHFVFNLLTILAMFYGGGVIL